MPGEDERRPGPPTPEAPEVIRLDAATARLETLGASLQRSVGETAESTATLSRTVGTVSADLGRLIGEAVAALGQTRRIVLATDDAVAGVAQAFENLDERIGALAAAIEETVEHQRRVEADRPPPEAVAAAVGAEVGGVLGEVASQLRRQLDTLVAELREERAVLARHVRELAKAQNNVSAEMVRAEVDAVVTPLLAELRDELAQLVTEVHEDRAVLTRRLASTRDVAELRDLVEGLQGKGELDEVRALVDALPGRDDIAELRDMIETLAAGNDEPLLERLRTDIEALADDVATTAKRVAGGQRAVEELRGRIEGELSGALQQALTSSAEAITSETESLMGELHDDLALVMRQVIVGNEELEALRASVGALRDAAAQETPEPASDEEAPDVAGQVVPVVEALREEVVAAVANVHEDLALVLKRLAAGQREVDDLREAVLAQAPAAGGDAAIDPAEIAGRVSAELAPPLSELGDDLSVLVRSVSGTQAEMDGIRAAVTDLTEAVAAARAAVEAAVAADEEEVGYEDVEVDEGPEVAELFDALRSDIDAGIGAAVSDLRDELDSVRRLVADQPAPLASSDVRAEVDALLSDIRDDIALLAQQLLNGQEELAALRAELVDGFAAAADAVSEPADDTAAAVVAAAESLALDVRGDVAALADDLQAQFERLRNALARSRQEIPAPPDLSELGPEVASEVTGAIEPVVSALQADLAVLAAQLDEARAAIEQLPAPTEPEPMPDVGAAVEAVVADLHDDLSVVLGQVVASQEEVRGLRDEVAAGQEDLRAVLDAVATVSATGDDDVHPVLEAMATAQEDTRTVLEAILSAQDEVRAALEEAGQRVAASPEIDVVLDAVVAGQADLRTVLDAVEAGNSDVRRVLDALAISQDDTRTVLDAVSTVRDEVGALLEASPEPAAPDVEHLEVAVADLPALMAAELRAELDVVVDGLRAGFSQLQAAVAGGSGGPDADVLAVLRADVQAFVDDLQTDLGTVIRELVAGQNEVSQLRSDLAAVSDVVADAVIESVTAALPAAPVEDPALAIEGIRVDVTAGLADMAAELRSDIEGLVAELHEDLGTLMAQVVAGQEDLEGLRQQLAEITNRPPAGEHVADDLDRLTRDLQALRDRLPGATAATPPRRRPRAHPGR